MSKGDEIMKSLYFAYRIEKEAGMAMDIETKEPTEAYMKVKIDVGQAKDE
jgi:hypothetical protein